MVPKATPIASPSGILCSVIDETSIMLFFRLLSLFFIFKLLNILSPTKSNRPPNKKLIVITNIMFIFRVSARDIAGDNSDQKEAAIITPAAEPSIASKMFLFMFLKNTTRPAPSEVIEKVNIQAIKACNMGFKLI